VGAFETQHLVEFIHRVMAGEEPLESISVSVADAVATNNNAVRL
jgi:hypothetical protein